MAGLINKAYPHQSSHKEIDREKSDVIAYLEIQYSHSSLKIF